MNTVHLPLPAQKIAYWVEHAGDFKLLHQPINGEYHTFTWKEIDCEARKLVTFLNAKGLVKGDTIALLSKNAAHWMIADFALMLGGFVSVPIYPTANEETITYVLEHAECKAIVLGPLDNWQSQANGIPASTFKIAMPYETMPADYQWKDIMATHSPCETTHQASPSDLMTILYTSGSTGKPKGAMHNYGSFIAAGQNIGARMEVHQEDRSLSYLPLSHCTERAYVESAMLSYGSQIYFVENLNTFSDNMAHCRPTIFGSVPRLWTQFQKGILSNMPNDQLQELLAAPESANVVKQKIKTQMGLQDARLFLSGSAPLSEKVLEWYRSLDINIAEGWGMTECFACGSSHVPGSEVRFGTVSQPADDADIIIADDGEILIKTESNMMGYFKDEEKTRETINAEGYVHTGDLGQLKDGYLSIVGRKKDIFKTEKGKYVAPVPIESEFGQNEFIEQICLMGTQLVQPVVVVNLSAHSATQDRSKLDESLIQTMNAINEKLEAHAKVGAIIVATQTWTTESGELTPTLKVKRHVVEKEFLPLAQTSERGTVTWH